MGNAPGTAVDKAGAENRAGNQRQGQEGHDWAAVLNISPNEVVQELGWDEDCDSSISEGVEDSLGEALLDYDTDEMVDVVLLWWRAEDGDLVDGLVDATRSLGDEGRIWLLTPAPGKHGALEPAEVAESAQLAGMVQTKSDRLSDWQGACLVNRGYKKQ